MSLRLEHNSRDIFYRRPIGAMEAKSEISLSLLVIAADLPLSVTLRTWQDDKGETLYPMTLAGLPENIPADADGKKDDKPLAAESDFVSSVDAPPQKSPFLYRVSFTLPPTGCLIWYYFIVKMADGEYFYGNNGRQNGGLGEMAKHEPPSFQITVYDAGAKTPNWFKQAVMYQIFPDRFCRAGDKIIKKRGALYHASWQDEPRYFRAPGETDIIAYDFFGGNFAGIEEKLPYLKDLGISVIYLNPIFEAASNHRYDTADYHAIDPILGGEEAFRHFLKKAEELGISVIIDGVFSHTGDDSRYFNKYGHYDDIGACQSEKSPYYGWYDFKNYPDDYESWWGFKNLPNVNEKNPAYQDFIIKKADSVLHHWLAAGVKGWRLDVIDELPPEFSQAFYRELKNTDPEAVLIGEIWEDASNKISYGLSRQYLAGHEIDGAMNYPLRRIILEWILGETDTYFTLERTASLIENYPRENLYAMMNLLSSHDVKRLITTLGEAPSEEGMTDTEQAAFRLDQAHYTLGKRRGELAALWQFAFPGVPSIYYGDEIGLEGHKDPHNRRPYDWENGDREILSWYKQIIALRNEYAALRTGYFSLFTAGVKNGGFAFCRYIKEGKDAFGQSADDSVFIIALNRQKETPLDFSLEVGDLAADDFYLLFTSGIAKETSEATAKESPSDEENLPLSPADLPPSHIALSYGRLHFRLPPLSGVIYKETIPARKYRREAGILCHITSLPPNGDFDFHLGDIGTAAHEFIDWLQVAGQTVWQILPLTEVGDGYSPYQSPSAFAGNPLLISPEALIDDGLLTRNDIQEAIAQTEEEMAKTEPIEINPSKSDYQFAAKVKKKLLTLAHQNFLAAKKTGRQDKLAAEYETFNRQEDYWLSDFVLYTALKEHFSGAPWQEWPLEYKSPSETSLIDIAQKLAEKINYLKFVQFVFSRQWQKLRSHAKAKGIEILGDLPLFISGDSADTWAQPELFALDENGQPTAVAGVPPDYFAADGQLWGNPQYDWEMMEKAGFKWWTNRLRRLYSLVDRVRIDHFRGLESYWEIPAAAKTAKEGHWVKGPGEKLFIAIRQTIGDVPIIAEDLGSLTPEVAALREKLNLPGMRVLQFELNENAEHRAGLVVKENTVVYTGTHDNNTLVGWYKDDLMNNPRSRLYTASALHAFKQQSERTAETAEKNFAQSTIEYAYHSRARLAIIPLQDILALDGRARMNTPGTVKGNWSWRLAPHQLENDFAEKIRTLAEKYGRAQGENICRK